MRNGLLGAVAALVLLTIVGWSYGESPWPISPPADPSRGAPSGGLITHHVPGGPEGDHIVVIDPAAKVMAVYRIQKDRGEIRLASVRQIQWDLEVTSYANEGPLPEEIRAGLQRQR